MKIKQQNGKGFTIIEVVLVLAIAGLIFLMVFIALPALQSSQRDAARKNDVGIVGAAINSYNGNNSGGTVTQASLNPYLSNLSSNVTKAAGGLWNIDVYSAGYPVGTVTAPADGYIAILLKATCGAVSTSGVAKADGTTRQYAVITKLESASTYYCQGF